MSIRRPAGTPTPVAQRALCVSVHDVSPTTWGCCQRLMSAVAEIAPVPLTLLVVPDYHRQGAGLPGWYRCALDTHHARGDELALHGYVHLDESPAPHTPLQWWRRRILTASEGEFAALPHTEARRRLAAGQAWFRISGWPLQGFVAPAWLLGTGAWQALEASPLRYTTTADAFHLLHPRRSVPTRCVVYSTRSRLRRALSLGWNGWNAGRGAFAAAGPVRLALHPDDARHPAVIAQIRRLLEQLLPDRVPMTKAALAAALEADGAASGVPAGDGAGPHAGVPECRAHRLARAID